MDNLVQCLDIVHAGLWPLLCGLGEVSVELGGVCRRVRLDGGDKRGLLLLTSLLGSLRLLCSSKFGLFLRDDLVRPETKGLMGLCSELFLVFTMFAVCPR